MLKRNSLFAIGLLLLLAACSGAKQQKADIVLPGPYLLQAEGGLVYDASFQYKDFHASGLLVMKRIKESEYHVVLVSKFGPSLMEFKLNEEGIQWIKSFDQLKKKSVEKLLERDFRVLMLTALDKPKKVKESRLQQGLQVYMVKGEPAMKIKLDPTTQRIMYAENRGGLNPVKTKVNFVYAEQAVPQKISLRHRNVRMGLDLNLLKVIHAEK